MSEKKVKWQELKDDLTQAINTFHHPESNRSLETIERCLSGLFDKHRKSTGTLLWAGYISDIHRNRSLEAHHKDVLYGAFVKFTTSRDLLREYLKFVITIRDSVGDTNSWDEDEDEESGGETPPPVIQPEDAAIVVTPGLQRTWREWVGSKILQNTPSLITPEPVSNVSMAVNIDKSILRLAVLNEADWVFPSDISSLGAAEQARIKKILEIGTPNDTLLETAVKGGNIKVVENLIRLLKSVNIDQSERGGMLHSAIEARRPEIAQLLVNEYPKIIEETPNNLSALQVLRKTEQFAKWKELEEFLVSKSVRRKTPSLVRRLLYDPNSQSSHLYADLSIFNDPIHNFDAFLASLEEKDFASLERKKYKVNFYSTLMYVKLPRLRNKEPNSNREEAFIVLNWLRTRSVRTILELHVPDAIKGPHTDELIEKWLGLEPEKDGFKSIETLNWERLDLSLETLKVIRGLQNVYLYTENWNTLAFWTSTEGLCSKDHENIQEVTIVIVQDNALSKARADKYRDKAIDRVNRAILERDSRIKNEGRIPQALTINVRVAAWGSEDSGEGTSDNHASNKVTPRQVTDLDHFLRQDPRQLISAREILADNFWPRPTRVAIIDNGVDAGINKIWDRVAESESFVEDDTKTRESSVWLASHPHGTQMASIVTDIDPHCLLYIAKVGTGKENLVSPDNIIAAIKWLAEFKVDVVVISLTLKTPDPGIAKAISNADDNGNGPIFLCATEDVGITGDKVYPAYFPQTIAIAACDRGGKESIYTDSKAHYYFQGYQIHTDCLSYGARQTDEPSGSSIATAIGAGVASLILSCKSLADAERRSRKTRLDTVRAVFNDMIDKTNSAKYVSPGKLFKGGEANGVTWSTDDWKNWIQNMFQPDGRYS